MNRHVGVYQFKFRYLLIGNVLVIYVLSHIRDARHFLLDLVFYISFVVLH